MKQFKVPSNFNYVAAFLTLRCYYVCSYCINKHGSFKSRGLEYYRELFSFYGIELIDYIKPKPFQCTQNCNLPVNTEQLRFKIKLIVSNPNSVDTQCIINSYFPAFFEVNVVEV